MGSKPYLTHVYLPRFNLVSARATSLLVHTQDGVRTQLARQVDDTGELDGVTTVPGGGVLDISGGLVIQPVDERGDDERVAHEQGERSLAYRGGGGIRYDLCVLSQVRDETRLP